MELFGIEKSKEMAREATLECLDILAGIPRDTQILADLAKTLMERSY